MSLLAGIDLGSSGLRIALITPSGRCLASAAHPLATAIPRPGWSEQDPGDWWTATCTLLDELAAAHPDLMARLAGISLSGHMLGSVLLDSADRPTAPCILWNDQRALAECTELLARVPEIGTRTAGQPDPGLTAPKLLWLARHMPPALDKATILLLPKDYLRLKLTGERATERTDAAGTLLMDCRSTAWDDTLIAAAGWDRSRLPPLLDSWDPAGQLRPELCQRWSTPRTVIVAAGSGDNFAGTLGAGATRPGQAALSIGTSGVLCCVDEGFHPAPAHAILTAPHAVPATYLSMAVIMSATQSLEWLAGITNTTVDDLATLAERRIAEQGPSGRPLARPSLTGIRTPHNRMDASGILTGFAASHDRADIAYAFMEGIAFQFHESHLAQRAAGVHLSTIAGIGGGTRSPVWVRLIATLLETSITIPRDSGLAACRGAARLAHAATAPADRDAILTRPLPTAGTVTMDPDPALHPALIDRFAAYRHLPLTPDPPPVIDRSGASAKVTS